jgi:E3 ubiquitin-protein ligase MARCH6
MYIGILSTWSQSVRDKEFLVEMRLRNLEPDKEKQKRERNVENTENGRQMVVENETEG